jgi:hypothetical protein
MSHDTVRHCKTLASRWLIARTLFADHDRQSYAPEFDLEF